MNEKQEAEQYIQSILDVFAKNPTDESLNPMARILLENIDRVQKKAAEHEKQIDILNDEIKERQVKVNQIVKQIDLYRGETNGYVNLLLQFKGKPNA